MTNEKKLKIVWNNDNEKLLIDWADKAMCFRWLHAASCAKYNRWNIGFTIPIIIISTCTGTANFSQDKIPINLRDIAAMIIGFFNIVAAILTTVHKFFKVTELSESHRLAAISWDKLYRRIKVELAQNPNYRSDAKDCLMVTQSEYDNLIDSSPYIETDIIKKFHFTFSGVKYDKCLCCCYKVKEKKSDSLNKFAIERIMKAKNVRKPVICDDIESIRDYLYSNDLNLHHRNKKYLFNFMTDDNIVVLSDLDNEGKQKEEPVQEPAVQESAVQESVQEPAVQESVQQEEEDNEGDIELGTGGNTENI